MNWLSTEFHAFIAWLAGVGAVVFSLVTAMGKTIAENGGPLLAQAAMDGVLAAEQKGGTGSEKLAAAQAAVIADLTAKGIPIVMNAVNGAIEAAVAKMKADTTATSSPSTASTNQPPSSAASPQASSI
jgi:Bacteriophage holin of superfamily 6 (Holin_LLH)